MFSPETTLASSVMPIRLEMQGITVHVCLSIRQRQRRLPRHRELRDRFFV